MGIRAIKNLLESVKETQYFQYDRIETLRKSFEKNFHGGQYPTMTLFIQAVKALQITLNNKNEPVELDELSVESVGSLASKGQLGFGGLVLTTIKESNLLKPALEDHTVLDYASISASRVNSTPNERYSERGVNMLIDNLVHQTGLDRDWLKAHFLDIAKDIVIGGKKYCALVLGSDLDYLSKDGSLKPYNQILQGPIEFILVPEIVEA